jgi:hypothetical protein
MPVVPAESGILKRGNCTEPPNVKTCHNSIIRVNSTAAEENVPVQITGVLPRHFDGIVRKVLHQLLDSRPQEFLVEISWPHSEMVVHFLSPLEKRLKFHGAVEPEIARELFAVVGEIMDEEFGPIQSK